MNLALDSERIGGVKRAVVVHVASNPLLHGNLREVSVHASRQIIGNLSVHNVDLAVKVHVAITYEFLNHMILAYLNNGEGSVGQRLGLLFRNQSNELLGFAIPEHVFAVHGNNRTPEDAFGISHLVVAVSEGLGGNLEHRKRSNRNGVGVGPVRLAGRVHALDLCSGGADDGHERGGGRGGSERCGLGLGRGGGVDQRLELGLVVGFGDPPV